MRFVTFDEVRERFRGRSVAVVGSGPSVLLNAPGFVDSHDVVVRVNNHKVGGAAGLRTDVHYSFYGTSIRPTATGLAREGVRLCMCKLPNSKPISSEWHERSGRLEGVDYRYIYRLREAWWFCDTFIPDDARFLVKFDLLGRHQPTTGFAAILDVLECEPASVYLTGFDFFTSGVHNVDERWAARNPDDPIRHRPDLEREWVARNAARFTFDPTMAEMMGRAAWPSGL
jgi:hypothetical protein